MESTLDIDPDNALGALIGRLGKVMHRVVTERFRTEGIDINIDQWIVLMHLWQEDGQNQAQLGETAGRNKTTVTRAIDALERKSLVVRVANQQDRRHRLIYLTHAGRETVQTILPHVLQIQDAASQNIAAEQLESCKAVLRLMFHNLQQLT